MGMMNVMSTEELRSEIARSNRQSVATMVLWYGDHSYETVVGPLDKAYDAEGSVSWWVGDRLVGTASSDASPIAPAPSLVFLRAGWKYDLSSRSLVSAA